ncbi:hypothetical protein [Pandoraea sputorum]|uniref:Uncharacterized protein n=1 Tax=Pandoraea sputorum TaxID=93222 RepID=A0A239SIN9_9BURK|nr:hypothetical protein [Pandoraea sputorum]AJC16894.1 hypothetical protein NA29_14425 [Pandoraea sputorum]SNU84543.1 Uncharacterised protein [Pandoraea sputorum]VVD77572.1 hypothetical protein PSP20601_00928 [Pandoraea sputorum]
MIADAIQALRSALHPCRNLASASAHLTRAMNTLQDRLQDCSPGSAELSRAIERVEAAFTGNDGWQLLKHCFERDVDRSTFVRRLVRNHVCTTPVGFEHVRRKMSEAQLDALATQLSSALRPHIREEIVDRWSQAEDTGVHLTEGGFIAVGIPGTDLRLSLMDAGFSHRGLNLTQAEVTRLLLARPDGMPPGATLLDAMPALTQDHALVCFRLIGAALGADGSLLPGLDPAAVRSVAAAAHDALSPLSGTLAEREPLARYFHRVGDDLRAGQSRQAIATIREQTSAQEDLPSDDIARAMLASGEDVRRANGLRVGIDRHRAAFHYDRAAQPRLAAEQYLAAANVFVAAGDRVMAAGNYASAAEKLSACETFTPMVTTLAHAIELYGDDFQAVSKLGARCAEVFAARGFHVSAAMVHELVFTRLEVLERDARVNAAALKSLLADHVAKAEAAFAAVGLSALDENVPSLIRSAIDARLDCFTTTEGLQGNGYRILFEDHSDMISAEEFDKNAPTEWVLLRRGLSTASHHVYELMTGDTRHSLISSRSLHPYLQRPLIESDFVDGVDALDMLTAATLGAGSGKTETASHPDTYSMTDSIESTRL